MAVGLMVMVVSENRECGNCCICTMLGSQSQASFLEHRLATVVQAVTDWLPVRTLWLRMPFSESQVLALNCCRFVEAPPWVAVRGPSICRV